MAKAARGLKSQAIQEYLSANPTSGPQQIVDGLKAQGIEVSFGLASAVNYRKPKKRASARKSAKRTVATDTPVSGSELIRRYIARHPAEKPKAIELGLKQEGVKVSMALIGRVKYAKGTKAGKRRKSSTQVVRVAARTTPAAAVSVEQLLEVKRFADSLGGADQLRQALDTLERLR
jgi:hypothetical protein